MNIILVRHGEDIDDKLTIKGKKQARLAAETLDCNITKIYSSPTFRARDTANIISKKFNNLPVLVDDRLNEREYKPQTSDIDMKEFRASYFDREQHYKNIEGCKDYLDRVFSFLDDLIKNNSEDAKILVVGHSSLSYAFFDYFSSSSSDHLIWSRLGNCSMLWFESKDKGDK